MRTSVVLVAAAATAVSAGPIMERTFGGSWSFSWGSYTEKAPWKDNSKPSWCHGEQISGIPTWSGGDWAKQCKTNPWAFWTMWYKPQWCKTGNKPKPIPSTPSTNPTCDGAYQVVFQDLQKQADTGVYAGQTVGAATVDNENYLTYGLATSVDGCLETCDKTEGCVFVNVYQDHVDNYPADVADLPESAQKKYAPGTLTCALYKACSDKDKATNFAGQQDPTKILNSDGYCKSGNCGK